MPSWPQRAQCPAIGILVEDGSWLLVYVAIVVVAGGIVLLRTLAWLGRTKRRRERRVERRKRLNALPSSTPLDDPEDTAREQAVERIGSHFTVTRRLLVPLIIATTLLLAGLPLLGRVPAAYLSLLVAALTVVLGVAARPVIENMIAGLVIGLSDRVSIGDTVRIEDVYGTVEDIGMTHTTIKIWDWRRFILPNRRMLESSFVNYSVTDRWQWAYVEFWVSLDADIAKVRELATEAPTSASEFHDVEPPRFWVMEMGKEAAHCWVAAWAKSPSDAWGLMHHTRTELIRLFQRDGIEAHGYRHELVASTSTAPSSAPANQIP